jgi:uncharacterized membrane protein
MFARVTFRVILSLVLVVALLAVAGGIASAAYHAGLAQGVQQGRTLSGSQGGAAAPLPFYTYAPYWFPPFGWGLGLLGCLFPLLLVFFVVSLVRLIVWGGHGYRHHGYGEPGPHGPWRGHRRWNEMAEEWHRRQHSGESGSPSGPEGQKP